MFVAAIKQSIIFSLCLTLGLLMTTKAQAAEAGTSLADLTSATLKFRLNLLTAEEKLFRSNQNTLTIYVNTDNASATLLKEIAIILDGKTIAQHSFSSKEHQAFDSGAMKKIYAAAIEPGQHELITQLNGSAASEEQNTTTITLKKGLGHDILKMTIANPLQKRRPELFFEQQRGDTP